MPFEVNQRVGDYEILGLLGVGGMGHVYRARNVISNRTEAMKVLLPDLSADRDLAVRFISEIRTLAGFDHPNIALLHTAFQLDNQLIMVMEYVEGFTLEQRAKQSPIPVPDVVEYISQSLSALAYAHSHGVIHRDIKPANLMITSHRVVKLMDFGSDQDVGKGIVSLLVNQLVNDGTYRIVDRQAMAKILAEQNFANSNRADAASASKIGKLLGANIIIVGDVTQFGRDDKHINAGGGGGNWYSRAAAGVGVNKNKAVVGITARMIDVNTGEILASTTATGESKRNGLALGGAGGSGWSGGGGKLDMGSSNFGQTILGEAVKDSVSKLALGLEASSTKLPAPTAAPVIPVDAVVADASGNEITINAGTGGGVRVGQTLAVTRVGRVIKDPTTGKVLRSVETPLGQLTVTSADAGSAVGTFSGTGQVKVGDKVKTP